MILLGVNTGSSSVRLALWEARGDRPLALARVPATSDPAAALSPFLEGRSVDAIVHRVVHGGSALVDPCRIDDAVRAEIARLVPLAPLHNPRALTWIDGCRAALPTTPQIAVFDTAFFARLPEVATLYALPRALTRRAGLRRYGFHGLAHRSMWEAWRRTRARGDSDRVITIQLGGGCSMAAIVDGRAIETSMGMTPLGGLMMQTRPGDLDPGVLLHLINECDVAPTELARMLAEESGLRGVSGRTGEVRELLPLEAAGDEDARRALALYVHRARAQLGAFLVQLGALGGVDAILFGGGVGEHEPQIRARILAGMEWCGVRLDARASQIDAGASQIDAGASQGLVRLHHEASRVAVYVAAVDEERLLRDDAVLLLERKP